MTTDPSQLVFKLATSEREIEQIQRLLYRTFVEEIPQHPPNSERRYVDRFHAENVYLAGLLDGRVVATLTLRTQRPFSLDAKLADLDRYLPKGYAPVEFRLLAVEPEFRHTAVFAALLEHAVRHALAHGFDLGVISGTTRQLRLYRHLGFTAFGPIVGTAEAPYQPMYVTLDAFCENARSRPTLRAILEPRLHEPNDLNFLPGPVSITPAVREALGSPPISHRSAEFVARMQQVRARLSRLAGARDVAVVVGSGTLANEIVALQLALGCARGLVLSNGEFGERLVGIARRARLAHDTLRVEWGEGFDLRRVHEAAARLPRGGWLWFVHHETSTGVLNPLRELVVLANSLGLRACADCVSTLGAVPVDLRGVFLATATSGKGLGSFPGLGLVFFDAAPEPAPDRLASYLDLGHWARHDSVPFTHSSNLVAALAAALEEVTDERMSRIAASASWLRGELVRAGFRIVARDEIACPAIVSIVPPTGLAASELGEQLDRRGFWTSYRSGYLLDRGWLQVALLGDPPRASLERLVHTLRLLATRSHAGAFRSRVTS